MNVLDSVISFFHRNGVRNGRHGELTGMQYRIMMRRVMETGVRTGG